jgi:XRE family transcriptional regulator, fatty acid utilization regulator
MSLGSRLRYARERAGYSLAEVQDLAGIGASSLSEFENDKREPRMAQLQALGSLYKRSLPFLLGEEAIESEVVLWRQKPEGRAANVISSRFLSLCRSYYHLEIWCKDLKPCNLPIYKGEAKTLDYREAEHLSHEVRRALQLGDYPAHSLLSVLQEVCGVKVFHQSFDPTGAAASTVSPSFGPAVLLNSKNVRWRRNFDLGHELFHLLTWGAFRSLENAESAQPSEVEEKLATCFARNLLMPAEVFRDSVGQAMEGDGLAAEKVFDLAREFDVSHEAIIWQWSREYRIEQEVADNLKLRCDAIWHLFRTQEKESIEERPPRYSALATRALWGGQMSIGRFAEFMGLSRSAALRIAEQRGEGDEKTPTAPS